MTTEIKEKREVFSGGWTTYHKPDADDKEVFEEAIKGVVGVKYSPFAVSTQVVKGVNYKYKCKASLPHAEIMWEAIVEIFAPLNGTPYVTGIQKIYPPERLSTPE